MVLSEIELCPSTCKKWHTKQFVANQLGVSLSMIYRYIKTRGLPEGALGGIYCPNIKDFMDGKFKGVQESSTTFKEDANL